MLSHCSRECRLASLAAGLVVAVKQAVRALERHTLSAACERGSQRASPLVSVPFLPRFKSLYRVVPWQQHFASYNTLARFFGSSHLS